MSGLQLPLTAAEASTDLEVVDGELVTSVSSSAPSPPSPPSPPPIPSALETRNLFGEAERIAARAASASTRRQYGAIFRAFGDWLAGEFGRRPVVWDLDADVIAAYGRRVRWARRRAGGAADGAGVCVDGPGAGPGPRAGGGRRGRAGAAARARAAGDAHR